MTKVSNLHRKWIKKKEYRNACAQVAPEFELARAAIKARVTDRLRQQHLTKRAKTTNP
jgi:hypothetical protein